MIQSLNLLQAINSALDFAMETDEAVCLFGEDVADCGGVFRATSNLTKKYGSSRCFNTPLTEQGIIGFANGMASAGLKPIAEIQFADYIFPAFDQIVNETAKFRYRTGNQFNVGGLTIRSPYGGGISGGLYHSQSPEAYFAHTPGLKIVIPSNPYQAKGLLLSAIHLDDPVLFFEPKKLYRASIADVPEAPYYIDIGKAQVVKQGQHITLVGWGAQLDYLHKASDLAKAMNIDCEIIDLYSILPWDQELVAHSVAKTGRLLIAHEAPLSSGFASEIAATIQKSCFLNLEAPIARVCGWDTPYPLRLEKLYIPNELRILQAIKSTVMF